MKTITITADDIAGASDHDPIHRAMRRAMPFASEFVVGHSVIRARFERQTGKWEWVTIADTPAELWYWMRDLAAGKPVEPITFTVDDLRL